MTFWIALYGAVLSTLLFIRSLSEGWPRLLLMKDGDDIVISLKNEGKHSLVVHRILVLNGRLRFIPSSPTVNHAVTTALNRVSHDYFQIVVAPQTEINFRLNVTSPARFYICWVFWNSARLRILPRLPMLFVISQNQLETLEAHSTMRVERAIFDGGQRAVVEFPSRPAERLTATWRAG